jgi:hypothetical protein
MFMVRVSRNDNSHSLNISNDVAELNVSEQI